jgi:hypothetical protein
VRSSGDVTCEAFPQAIPYAIFMGLFDHSHPYDYEGQDDHGMTYIPIEEEQRKVPMAELFSDPEPLDEHDPQVNEE